METETRAIESSALQAKWSGRAAIVSAGLTGLAFFTGNSTLGLVGGAALVGSLAATGIGLLGVERHKDNVKQMGGTRDLIEGWKVTLSPS